MGRYQHVYPLGDGDNGTRKKTPRGKWGSPGTPKQSAEQPNPTLNQLLREADPALPRPMFVCMMGGTADVSFQVELDDDQVTQISSIYDAWQPADQPEEA